jgi:hypothetical protein
MDRLVVRGAVIAILLLCACSSPVVSSPPPAASPTGRPLPTIALTAAPSAAPTAAPLTGWRVAPLVSGAFRSSLEAVAPFKDGLVSIGAIDDQIPAVLISSDGLTWTIAADRATLGDVAYLKDVAANDAGVVILGASRAGDGTLEVVTWFSADGVAWNRSRLPGDSSIRPSSIATRNGTWVTVGSATDGEVLLGPRAWASNDGQTWHAVAGFEIDSDYGALMSVVASPGGFVALGASFGEPPSARVWLSDDGFSWILASQPTGIDGMRRLRVIRGDLVALSSEIQGPPIAAWSDDGVVWRAIEIEGFSGAYDIVEADRAVLLVGRGSEQSSTMAVAVSSNLGSWVRQPTEPSFAQFLTFGLATTADGSTVVGVGNGGTESSGVIVLGIH